MGCVRSQFATPSKPYITCADVGLLRVWVRVASNLSLAEHVFEDHSDRLLQVLLQNMWSYNMLTMAAWGSQHQSQKARMVSGVHRNKAVSQHLAPWHQNKNTDLSQHLDPPCFSTNDEKPWIWFWWFLWTFGVLHFQTRLMLQTCTWTYFNSAKKTSKHPTCSATLGLQPALRSLWLYTPWPAERWSGQIILDIRGFPEIGAPQIIHFNRIFPYKPSILG